jgi:hypothetical protein
MEVLKSYSAFGSRHNIIKTPVEFENAHLAWASMLACPFRDFGRRSYAHRRFFYSSNATD